MHGCDLLVGSEAPNRDGATREQCRVLGSLVGCEYEARVTDEPQWPVGLLAALLQQLAYGRLTRRLPFLDTSTRQFPPLAKSIEDHEDTVGVPQGDQCRRQWRVTRWRGLCPAGKRDQGVAAIVNRERWVRGIKHLAMIPGPPTQTPIRSHDGERPRRGR